MRRHAWHMILLVTLMFAPVRSQEAPGDERHFTLERVVAMVNGRPITEGELCARLMRAHGPEVLGQMITELLLEDEASALGVRVTDGEILARTAALREGFSDTSEFANWMIISRLTMEDLHRQVRLGILQERLVVARFGLKVTPAEVDSFSQTHEDLLGTPAQVRLSHIVVGTEHEAREVLVALEAGADFAKLAALKSLDETTREEGGDLGFFPVPALLPEIAEAIASLKPGEVSGILPADGAFRVVKLTEVKPPVPARLDTTTRAQIQERILRAKIEAALPRFFQELHAKASVTLSGALANP